MKIAVIVFKEYRKFHHNRMFLVLNRKHFLITSGNLLIFYSYSILLQPSKCYNIKEYITIQLRINLSLVENQKTMPFIIFAKCMFML